MKKLLLILFLVITSQILNAQALLGYTEYQIKAEFPDYTFTSGSSDDGIKFIYTNFSRATFAYYFNAENKCNFVKCLPFSQGDLNYYVEAFNSTYVIISDIKWKAYFKDGGIMNIKLIYDSENELSFFLYY